METYKKIFNGALAVVLFFFIAHLIVYLFTSDPSYRFGIEAIVTLICSYIFPVFMVIFARREAKKGYKAWKKAGFFAASVFALTYLGMVVFLTWKFIQGLINGRQYFEQYYTGEAMCFGMVMIWLAVLWYLWKGNGFVIENKGWIGKLVYALPYIVFIGIVGVLLVGSGGATSFSWWGIVVLVGLICMPILVFTLLLRGVYNVVMKGKQRKKAVA